MMWCTLMGNMGTLFPTFISIHVVFELFVCILYLVLLVRYVIGFFGVCSV